MTNRTTCVRTLGLVLAAAALVVGCTSDDDDAIGRDHDDVRRRCVDGFGRDDHVAGDDRSCRLGAG